MAEARSASALPRRAAYGRLSSSADPTMACAQRDQSQPDGPRGGLVSSIPGSPPPAPRPSSNNRSLPLHCARYRCTRRGPHSADAGLLPFRRIPAERHRAPLALGSAAVAWRLSFFPRRLHGNFSLRKSMFLSLELTKVQKQPRNLAPAAPRGRHGWRQPRGKAPCGG